MNNEKIIAWAVMKDGECLSVRRFEPVASGEAEGVEFVPLVRFAEQPAQQQEEFPLRGILASELKCWHRLTEDEAQNLLAFVQNMPSKPAQQEPYCWMSPEGTIYQASDEDVLKGSIPMYLGKPPAQRKPLTDEQIDKLPWGPHEGNPVTFAEGLRDFARAIEAAHGIKGDA